MMRRLSILSLFLFSYIATAVAQSKTSEWMDCYHFSAITTEEGLPNNFVDDILKDRNGFLWVATLGEGLARFDGYDFISFNTNSKEGKLRSNFVRSICEDPFGRIWAASESGIDIIEATTLRSAEVSSIEGILAPLVNKPIHHIYKSKEGILWVCSENKLYRVTFGNLGEVKEIVLACELMEGDQIDTFCEVDDQLWFNSHHQVVRIQKSDGQLQKPTVVSEVLQFPETVGIEAMYRKENEMWIGTTWGLFRYNMNNETIRHYLHESDNRWSLSQNFITAITETSDHTLLIATLKGLNIYDALNDRFVRINRDEEEQNHAHIGNTINNDFINCMLSDNELVWLGTEIGGVNKMYRRKLMVENYMHSSMQPGSLSKNPVNAIYEDAAGTLWVGTVEGGLNRKTRHSKNFEHYTSLPPTQLSHNSVSCFTTDNKERLWIGTWGGGIGWIDTQSTDKTFHHIEVDGWLDFSWGLVGTICYDALNHAIWVGTSTQIYLYDLQTKQLSLPFGSEQLGGIEGCAGYYIDRDNQLWLGLSAGLCRVELQSLKAPRLVYQLWRNRLSEPHSKQRERVTFITQGSDGTIWVGSNGYGVYRSSVNEDGEYQFQALTTENGLINNSVRGIQEDREGNLWITTTHGLSCYHPTQNSFANYTTRDGLSSNQFYWNAIAQGRNGEIYAGGTGGLSVIKSVTLSTDLKEVPLAFTKVQVANQESYPEQGVLKLHERDKSLYLEFAALDYDSSNQSAYYYRLKGFDEKWIKTSNKRRTATYTNLAHGEYIFELLYAPDGINTSEESKQLVIQVAPYFYKTIWFLFSISLFMLLLFYRIWAFRIRSLKRQQELLHQKVEIRTRELEEQKKQLANQASELYHQNELLTEKNEKITRQKSQLVAMSKKVQELTIDKLAFFTNITHEFRTPLTLIIGPIERALKLSYNPQVIEQLSFVSRNSKYLLSLVNQLMDFRKVESGKMEIVQNAANLECFLNQLIVPFQIYAEERGVRLTSHLRLPNPEILLDEDAMHKVMTNLLSNALKFTPKGGCVDIYASTYQCDGKAHLFIAVKDTGVGLPQEDINKIFNRFYQSNNQQTESVAGQSGTGIGLYLCKRIVQLHGGVIRAKNNRIRGCSFCITLPIEYTSLDSQANNKELAIEPKVDSERLSSVNGGITILVVEDNNDMRDYICSILRNRYTLLEAKHGEEALQILRSCSVDFIISDLMMPVMDGMELSRQVKADFALSHLPFLMLTAKTAEESRLEGFKTGVDEYLLKPFDDELLLARIENIIANRKRLQQKFSISMDVDSLSIDCDSSDKKFLDKIIQTVKENFQNSYWEVGDLIEAMAVSKSLLNKKMQSLTGQSAGQFMRNYRLNIARELIERNTKTKGMNISEIAYEVGFNDPKYFTRCFSKQFGVTPSSLLEAER
ncbi:MAG: hybrid sensor histidine kinase/response regulator transcription factor [Phocaeicola sp.]